MFTKKGMANGEEGVELSRNREPITRLHANNFQVRKFINSH